MSGDTAKQNEKVDPRVLFAAERTLLAWIRTGLAMMGFGFVVARFGLFLREIAAARGGAPVQQGGVSLWFGTGLICLAVAINLYAARQYVGTVRGLMRGEVFQPQVYSMGVVLAAVLSLMGAVIAVYLAVLN